MTRQRALAVAAVLLAVSAAGEPSTPIPSIQGAAHRSPHAGNRVRATGVVTSVAGPVATLQDLHGDGDPITSDAVFLELAPQLRLRPGDRVEVVATVAEVVPGGDRTANLSVTTLVDARVRVTGQEASLPRPAPLASRRIPRQIISEDELPVDLRDSAQVAANRFDPEADAIDYLESLEAMRVVVRAPVAVAPLRSYGPAAADVVVLSDGGSGVPASRRTAAGGILLQSGPENRGSQNPERIRIKLDAQLLGGARPAVAVGDRLADVTGVLRYDFGSYEVAATAPLRVRGRVRRADVSASSEPGTLTIASYNVLNLSAGPEDSAQRARLAGQIAGPLGAPAILALQEIQDDSGERDDGTTGAGGTLTALAAAIRQAGGPGYAWVEVPPADGRPGGAPGGNIRNAFLYDSVRVRLRQWGSLTPGLLGEAGFADTAVFLESRDPLIGVFEPGPGRTVTVINNHLASRFGSTPAFGAVQPFVQAGEAERRGQVRALHHYVAHLLARDRRAAVVVLGDMNTFEFSDMLADVLPGGPRVLHPLIGLVPAAQRYTYNFEGNSQVLDHVFVTDILRPRAGLVIPHLNVDYPASDGPAASDHEPVLATLRW